MIQYFNVIFRLAQTLTKAYFRDKVALFFTFVFPLIFLLVFGSLNSNNDGVSFDVAIINESKAPFAQKFTEELNKSGAVKEKKVTSLEQAKEQMGRGELDTIVVMSEEFGLPNQNNQPSGNLLVYVDPNSTQTGQTFASIMESVLSEIESGITGQKPLFSVEQVSTGKNGLEPFDYVFAGLLGFSILSLGFFGPTNSIPSQKKEGILRRLRTTPLRTSQYVLGTTLNYLLVGVITIALLFIVGLIVFDFKMQGSYLAFALIAAFGVVMMFGFGLAVGGWAKNENQAAPLTNLIAFPMMFLSGVFFPRFLMPEWLQSVSDFLPLTPLIDGIRKIITEGQSLLQLGPELAIMTAWTVVIYIIAFRVFRWE